MMGRTHAATGLLAGLLLGPALGLDRLAEVGPFAVTCAGYALLPDLDHPSSTVTRTLGPVTGIASAGLRRCSAALYRATKGRRDEPVAGTHRHASHTLIFAALIGLLCWASTAAWGVWAVTAWLAFGLLLAYDRLGKLVLLPFGVAAATWIPQVDGPAGFGAAALAALTASAGWLGIAVAAGCVVHCLGDALTESGCPFLFPLSIRGETWYEIRPPAWLRLHTGRRGEKWVVFPLVLAGCIAAIPGLLPHLLDLLHSAPSASTTAIR